MHNSKLSLIDVTLHVKSIQQHSCYDEQCGVAISMCAYEEGGINKTWVAFCFSLTSSSSGINDVPSVPV